MKKAIVSYPVFCCIFLFLCLIPAGCLDVKKERPEALGARMIPKALQACPPDSLSAGIKRAMASLLTHGLRGLQKKATGEFIPAGNEENSHACMAV